MKSRIAFSLLAAAALAFSACSKSENKATGANETPVAQTIQIEAGDTMKYNVTEIHAAAGSTIKVTLTNVGKIPKAAMGHNWILLPDASLIDSLVQQAPNYAGTDYIPASFRPKILASTRLLGPGESDSAVFTVPAKGSYPFLCSFPAHYAAGMKGTLVSE